ncbi:MAG: YeeE/YedE family protein [Paracoccaceae bacterium]
MPEQKAFWEEGYMDLIEINLIETVAAGPLIGLLGGLVLGLAARRGRFCTLGAIEDALYGQDWDRIRMWGLALAVAILGTFVSAHLGMVDISESLYARQGWNPVASILGGLIFGYGMAIAGNCGYGALARLGGGDLRSLVIVIVTGVSAYLIQLGPLAPLRVYLFPAADPGKSHGYAHFIGENFGFAPLVPAVLVAAGLAAVALVGLRAKPREMFWGAMVGLAITSGWIGTSLLAEHSFDVVVVESHSFTAPLGETLLFLMTGSAGGLNFAVGSVTGVVLGALLGSISKGHFRWEACDDPGELGRQILGGFLMGIGGVLALGCSVGQGLTAFSTLAFSAPFVLAAIVAGAALGLRQLIQGFEPV